MTLNNHGSRASAYAVMISPRWSVKWLLTCLYKENQNSPLYSDFKVTLNKHGSREGAHADITTVMECKVITDMPL